MKTWSSLTKEAKEWTNAHRRLALSSLALALAFLVVVRLFPFSTPDAAGNIDWTSNIRGILDELISAIVVGGVVSIALWWTRPPSDRMPTGYEVLPSEISQSLEAVAKETDEWEYVGHTGRYVRNRIFEIIRQESSRKNKPIRIRMVVLNPANEKLCHSYAKYRNSSRSKETFKVNWDAKEVQRELVITLLKTISLHVDPNYVKCEIGFRNFLSQYRSDRSADQVMITQEDPQEPAFSYPRGSKFFEYSKRENQLIWEQCQEFDLAAANEDVLRDVGAISAFVGQQLPELKQDIIEYAHKNMHRDSSPYA